MRHLAEKPRERGQAGAGRLFRQGGPGGPSDRGRGPERRGSRQRRWEDPKSGRSQGLRTASWEERLGGPTGWFLKAARVCRAADRGWGTAQNTGARPEAKAGTPARPQGLPGQDRRRHAGCAVTLTSARLLGRPAPLARLQLVHEVLDGKRRLLHDRFKDAPSDVMQDQGAAGRPEPEAGRLGGRPSTHPRPPAPPSCTRDLASLPKREPRLPRGGHPEGAP